MKTVGVPAEASDSSGAAGAPPLVFASPPVPAIPPPTLRGMVVDALRVGNRRTIGTPDGRLGRERAMPLPEHDAERATGRLGDCRGTPANNAASGPPVLLLTQLPVC